MKFFYRISELMLATLLNLSLIIKCLFTRNMELLIVIFVYFFFISLFAWNNNFKTFLVTYLPYNKPAPVCPHMVKNF